MKFNKLILILILTLTVHIFLLTTQKVVETDTPYFTRLGENLIKGNSYIDIENRINLWFPPFYPLLIGILSLLIDNLELISRLIPLIFSLLTLIPFYFFVKKIFNKNTAIISTLIFSLYPPLNYISTIGYSDSIYIFFIVFLLYLSWLALTKNSYVYYIFSGVLVALSYLTKHEGVAYLLIIILLMIIFKHNFKRIIPNSLILILTFLIISSPYLLFLHNQIGQWQLTAKTSTELYSRETETYTQEYEKNNFALNEDKTKLNLYSYERDTKEVALFLHIIKNFNEFVIKYIKNLLMEIKMLFLFIFPFFLLPFIYFGIKDKQNNNFKKTIFFLFFLIYPILLFPIFTVDARYLLPTLPILIPYLSLGLKKHKSILIIFIIFLFISNFFVPLAVGDKYEKNNQPTEHKITGLWLKENYSNPIVMSRKPWVSFYSSGIFVMIPYSDYKDLIKYACYKDVTHLVIDERYIYLRPQLSFLLDKETKELKNIYQKENPRIIVYKLIC